MSLNSSQRQTDLRVRRTEKFLWEALLSLLDERRFEQISVTDICERAMVHRATFYKHYESKEDLVTHGMKRMIDQMAKEIHSGEQRECGPGLTSNLAAVFDHFARYKRFYQFLLDEENFAPLQSLLWNELETFAEDRLTSVMHESKGSTSIPPAIIAQFVTGAVLKVLAWWLKNDMPVSAEQMAEYLSDLFSRGPDFFLSEIV